MPIERNTAEILAAHWDACKADLVKCLPATVLAVNTAAQTVDVQIGVNGTLFDELGNVYSVPAPSLTGVPIGVLRGGGFLIWVPVVVGDYVMLHFTDRSMDNWQASTGSAVDPGNVAMHTHDSCYAVPMIAPAAKALASPSGSNVVIGKDGADAQIVISASDIALGASPTGYVALANLVSTELTKIATALASLTVTSGAGAPGNVTAGTPYTTPGSVAATTVRAQ